MEDNAKKTGLDEPKLPYLYRFMQFEPEDLPELSSPERGGESNPVEEAPKPEPTRKTPHGD